MLKLEVNTFEEAVIKTEELIAAGDKFVDVSQLPGGNFEIRWLDLKQYTAHDGKSYPDEIWDTQDGVILNVQDMSPEHARNALRMILRNTRAYREKWKELTESIENMFSAVPTDDEDGPSDIPSSESNHTIH
jgi:hypothetical protein